ncbi:hypothetical protein PANT_27d00002 [Moesziomyces antarcticus T-34]|uniref:GAR domain-containing protein n=1 Tax=Pseudozyma antarctica (strain T-34) TaxID=1151754 RepID=M9LTA0_PSEA3|nr:hypothetical protein PANT_27d00002 [Moesziomyces antarcticus T-34]
MTPTPANCSKAPIVPTPFILQHNRHLDRNAHLTSPSLTPSGSIAYIAMSSAMSSRERFASNAQDAASPRVPFPSSPASRRAGHARSASILSSSSSVSIPSRSSSVIMSPAAVPARSSSIANSPSKSRTLHDARTGLPLTASDLADTIAGLTLAEGPTLDASSTHIDTPETNAQLDASFDVRTPQPLSAPFAPPVLKSTPPHSANCDRNTLLSPPLPDLGDRRAELLEIGDEINDAHDAIQLLQADIFSIQEQRHGSRTNQQASSLVPDVLDPSTAPQTPPNGALPAGVDLSLMQLDEKLESLSRVMQQLEVRLANLVDPASDLADSEAADSSIIDNDLVSHQSRARRASTASDDSLGSLDGIAFPGFAPALTPLSLRSKYADLCTEWAAIQEDIDGLKKELADDRYLDVFRSISTQAEGMMDSLDKAVSLCHIFIEQIQQDHAAGRLQPSSAPSDELDAEYDIQAKHDQLADLTKTFNVKKAYYFPACQQVFHSLEKGCKERQTSNGTILRRLSDLRSRWRVLRDALAKTERDLKRTDALFRRVRSDSSSSSVTNDIASPATSTSSLPPVASKLRPSASMQTGLGLGTPARASASQKRISPASSSSSRVASGPSRLSSSSSVGSNLSNTTPAAATPQRLRRISATAESLGLHTKPAATPPRSAFSRQLDVPGSSQRTAGGKSTGVLTSPSAFDSPIRNRATSMANAATGAVEKGVLGRSPGARPISMIGGRPAAGGVPASRTAATGTPSRPPPSSFKPSWHDLDAAAGSNRARAPLSQSMPRSQSQVLWPSQSQDSGKQDDTDESIEYLKFGEGSSPARPASSAGQYYRPPSAQGNVGDAKSRKRDSMIPRLSVRNPEGESTPSRPGSAMSQNSTSTPMRYSGASRLSMQTPEPAIVARAQRLSMYARAPSTGMAGMNGAHTPSKRPSKPPPTRRNGALASGRATPLSAAALASLPSAEPGASLKRSSISNLRSLHNGRTTPTASENGSVGGLSAGTWYGAGRGARGVSVGAGSRIGSGSVAGSSYGATGAIELYRANPNDALDVEVAAICNGLGVALERIDPPLPRGVRLEEGPGKDNRAMYEIGGRKMSCRLLELHRPAGSAGARAGSKAKKILVRVGGGWQDLEQWLLGRLSSA